MKIKNVKSIVLDKQDLRDEEVDKPLSEIHWSDFKDLTQDLVNEAWVIQYQSMEGIVQIKNKCVIESGYHS